MEISLRAYSPCNILGEHVPLPHLEPANATNNNVSNRTIKTLLSAVKVSSSKIYLSSCSSFNWAMRFPETAAVSVTNHTSHAIGYCLLQKFNNDTVIQQREQKFVHAHVCSSSVQRRFLPVLVTLVAFHCRRSLCKCCQSFGGQRLQRLFLWIFNIDTTHFQIMHSFVMAEERVAMQAV